MSTQVFGSSDDLIEFRGDCGDDEIGSYGADEEPTRVAMSDGTVLQISYDGEWHIETETVGPLFDRIDKCDKCPKDDDGNYSDVAHFKDGITGARSGLVTVGKMPMTAAYVNALADELEGGCEDLDARAAACLREYAVLLESAAPALREGE